ncbi:hypothetical protein E8E11_001765 [Didymella keratinophila]|nr:hypothetical protein E8E11_001765 [Didymella keratinophila]
MPSAEARDTIIEALQHTVIDAATRFDEVEQYLVTIPLEDTSKSDVYIIEEFTSQDKSKCFEATAISKRLRRMLDNSSLLSVPPEIHVNPIAIKTRSGSPLPLAAAPAVLLVSIEYKPRLSSNAVAGWKEMAKGAVQSVPGVNVFTVAEDAGASTIRTVEVLESWDDLSVLVKTDAAKKNIEHNGIDRTGVKSAIKLRAVAGFVGR